MRLTIDLGGSHNPLDDLDRLSDCFGAIDDLLQGCHIQERERERLATLIGTLGLLQQAVVESLRDARLEAVPLHAVG